MAQAQYPQEQFPDLRSALLALADNPDALDRARGRFSDAPPSYRSQESTALASPSLPEETEQELEQTKWELIQAHCASLPHYQFNLQVRTEYERMKLQSDWRGRKKPEHVDLYTFAEETILEDWKRQGICRKEWNGSSVLKGRWKHEEPPDLDSESESDVEEYLHPENMGALMAVQRAELEADASSEPRPLRSRVIRQHNRQMSRPYHQFLWQISIELKFLEFKLRNPGPRWTVSDNGQAVIDASAPEVPDGSPYSLPPDLNSIAYENVLQRWKDQHLFLIEWGPMPGFTWLHETPLSYFLRDQLGDNVQVPSTIFQGGPISQEEIQKRRHEKRQQGKARAEKEEQTRPRLFSLTGNNTQPSQAGQFANSRLEPSRAGLFANGRLEPSRAGQFANGRHEPSLVEHFANLPQQPASPESLAPAAPFGGGLFGLPNNPEPVRGGLFGLPNNPTPPITQFPPIFSNPNATTQRASPLFGPREENPPETATNRPMFQTPLIGRFADLDSHTVDKPAHGNPSPPPEDDDSASTRTGSTTSTSSYKTVQSTSSPTSASNRKRQADTPEPPRAESPPRTRSRRSKDQIQDQVQEQVQEQTQSASKRRPSRPPEPQLKPKRRQQAPRATSVNKKTATTRNGQVSPPSSNEAPTLRRSPRLQKMKQKDKTKGKGKGKSKGKGK
jgi:hypothetical protein